MYELCDLGVIATVGVAGGSVRVLKTTAWTRGAPWNLSFSPDGKFVLFDSSPAKGAEQRDLYLVSADGRREVHLVEHPADDQDIGWSPDGRTVLFSSDRTGEWDLWSVAVSDGKAQGAPVLVKRSIGRVTPLGVTCEGALYCGLTTGLSDVYVANSGRDTQRSGSGTWRPHRESPERSIRPDRRASSHGHNELHGTLRTSGATLEISTLP